MSIEVFLTLDLFGLGEKNQKAEKDNRVLST